LLVDLMGGKDTANRGRRDPVIPGDLTQALAAAAIAENGFAVDGDGLTADVAILELGSAHAGFHSLDDQVAFELGDRTDDDDDGPAQRAGRVDALAKADELDVEAVELVQDLQEVPGGSGDAIAGPDQDNIGSPEAARTLFSVLTARQSGDLEGKLRNPSSRGNHNPAVAAALAGSSPR
jgi:hypothetical protein